MPGEEETETPEGEQRTVAPVHCYANTAQIGVLNLALMMPFGALSPASLTPMQRCTLQMLVYYVHQSLSLSPRGGLLAAATAALAVTE